MVQWHIHKRYREIRSNIFSGLIFVVDSSDRARIDEAKEELFGIVKSDQMRGVPVVVIANKQDLPGKLIKAKFNFLFVNFELTWVLHSFRKNHFVHEMLLQKDKNDIIASLCRFGIIV